MITVILAEKPDQAEKMASSLGNYRTINGVHVLTETPFLKGEVRVVAAEGHLFEFEQPKTEWKLENLPLVNVTFQKTLSKDKAAKGRFDIIKREVLLADEIIIGTDADREGERIAYITLFKILGKDGLNKIKYRLWPHSMTKKGLQEAFQQMKDPKETYNYFLEAEARAQSDWLVGMNLSPLATLDLQKQNLLAKKRGSYVSVGRVQTPLVRLICENDQAIKTFKPQPYFKIYQQDQGHDQVIFSNHETFETQEMAFDALKGLKSVGTIISVDKKEIVQVPPLPFTISELQAFGGVNWGKTSSEVKELIKSLYNKGYLSYPRTDVPHIPRQEFEGLKANRDRYCQALNFKLEATELEPRETHVKELEAGQSHYGLIPTEEIPILSDLSYDERRVYYAVVKRALLMFASNFVYQTTTVGLDNDGILFSASGRQLLNLGYRQWIKGKAKKDVILPEYVPGDVVDLKGLTSKLLTTRPPKRITEAQLIGEIMLKYGLGTAATRDVAISRIQELGYVKRDKSTGQFRPTAKGYLLYDYMKESEFSDPETTAGWEYFLSEIGAGTTSPQDFVNGIKDKITNEVNRVKARYL